MAKMITQIGSLPYMDAAEAVEYSMRYAARGMPFLPELPGRGDSMLDYIKNPGSLSCLDEFKRAVRSRGITSVKMQCVGPVTLAQRGYGEADATQRIYSHIRAMIDGVDAEKIIFLDEPALGHTGLDFRKMWGNIIDCLAIEPGLEGLVFGVHTCGDMNWTQLFSSDMQIISFDASRFDLTTYQGYRNGKTIAWGVTDLSHVRDFQEGDLITLPCGMSPALYSVEDCGQVLERLELIAEKLEEEKKRIPITSSDQSPYR
ncbi:TPA: hypothetical protein HA265_04630 [Candidatus Woesearchaeota archaeon]|nr:hypothetical protein [Candidatus Woesearchaeota archaeon]